MADEHDDLEAAIRAYQANPDDYYAHGYAEARNGDADAARELLSAFVAAVNARQPIPAPILDYLCLAFSEYLTGEDIGRALLVVRPKQRPKGSPRDPVRIVADMYLTMKRDDLNKTAAKIVVCGKWHVERRTLEKYDREYSLIRTWDMDMLRVMAQPTAPEPPKR